LNLRTRRCYFSGIGPAVADEIHVIACADDVFAMPLAVTTTSVILHARRPERLRFTVIDCGISRRNSSRIRRSLEQRGARVRFARFTSAVPSHWVEGGVIPSAASFAPLFIQDYVEEDVAIYLDSDTVVRVDLAPLAGCLEDGMLVAGVPDAQGDGLARNVRRLAGLLPAGATDSPYVNSGVMVLDLAAARADDLSSKYQAVMADSPPMLFADQDLVNIVCAGRIQQLDRAWNVQTHSLASLDDALLRQSDGPRIVHYTKRPKPWHLNGDVGIASAWYESVDRTEWKGFRPTRARVLVPKLRRGWRLLLQRPQQVFGSVPGVVRSALRR